MAAALVGWIWQFLGALLMIGLLTWSLWEAHKVNREADKPWR